MKDRIKKIRQEFNLTQQEFADRIGVSRNNIASYETGKSCLGVAVVSLICREFNVNEEWLRNGTGEMFLPANRYTEITRLTKQLLDEEEDSFKNRFISMLANLNVEEWELLERKLKQLYDKNYHNKKEN